MKLIHALFGVVLFAASLPVAQASHEAIDASASFSLSVGTILTLGASSDLECHDHHRHGHCHDYYKVAALEAAEYVAGGDRGPMLNAFISTYPDRAEDDILDAIFKAAEGL